MALDFTFLTENQIWGDKRRDGQLDIMKRYGTRVAPTDLTVILGGYMTDHNDRTRENDLTCAFFSKSLGEYSGVRCASSEGAKFWTFSNRKDISVRPALSPQESNKIQPTARKIGIKGIEIVEYGEYPQTIADERTTEELVRLLNSGALAQTGEHYTFNSAELGDSGTSYKARSYPTYELNDKRYICVQGHPACNDSVLSTGEQVEEGKPYWVEVQPIEWLMDPSGTMVAKKCLFSGIPFDTKETYDGSFSKTLIKHHLDTYFAKEIGHEKIIKQKAIIKGLSEKLAEISDLEKVKKMVKPARIPERTEQLARITRVRRAKEILSSAAQKAQKEGDQETLLKIMELAKPFAVRDAVIRDKFHKKRLKQRAQKDRG